ncbi:pre-mrna splicing factor clf1 [Ophiostoma piceae UAMH 11346]|uniref:Pre-mrna splicing factor clf1 n=1 Tax=Ophiostoma piceae (strain UAMH 11346) TaxID=1262450 RepID=S3C4Z8_OPHP1|nr:pre-mrna splicing factor clf1 [Ophiostoma piceae UAMH 11346]
MSLPQPAVAIDSICSVVWNNTLYTYSANAFQSLSLSTGAKWKSLAPGEPVTGGVCVGSTPGDASLAGFYVVGGSSSNATYPGLQKFTYATAQWATITPESLVTQSRLYHGAAYINATDSIVMYAGVQDGSASVSQQTFSIQASAPYAVVSYQSTAPAATNPYVLPWSNTQAVMIGGSTANTQVMLFDPSSGGWTDSGATLASPMTIGIAGMQVALVTGDDNSKNLYTFDETVSPNQVSRIVLVDGTGAAVTNAGPAKRSVYDNELMEEDLALFRRASLTQSNWPAYNATLAPTTTRSNFGIGQNADGMIVLAGGTTSSDVLCIFDGRTNGWQNATKLLVQQKKATISTSSSSSSSSSSSTSASSTLLTAATATASVAATTTAEPAATSSAAVAAATGSSLSANALLGIVLGSVAGVGIILLALYLLIMRSRRKNQQSGANSGKDNNNNNNNTHNRNMSGQSPSEKSMSAIANDSLTRPPGAGVFRGGHQAQDSMGSITSVGIMMGRVNQPRQPETKHSNLAHATSFKGTISRPILQTQDSNNFDNFDSSPPRQMQNERSGIGAGAAAAATSAYGRSVTNPRDSDMQQLQQQNGTRRSSGWNRYWSGGSALNLLGFGSGNNAKRTTVASDASSNYSSNNLTSSVAGVGIGGNGYAPNAYARNEEYNRNRITQDSATVPPLEIPGMPEAKPRFQRVNSGSPTIANYEHYIKHGTMFEGMKGTIERSNSHNSATSSRSGYSSGIPASVHEAWDPTSSSDGRPWGSDRAPSSAYGPSPTPQYPSAPAAATTNTYNGSNSNKKYVPTGMSQQPQLAMANTSSDMSWLNLGDVSRV